MPRPGHVHAEVAVAGGDIAGDQYLLVRGKLVPHPVVQLFGPRQVARPVMEVARDNPVIEDDLADGQQLADLLGLLLQKLAGGDQQFQAGPGKDVILGQPFEQGEPAMLLQHLPRHLAEQAVEGDVPVVGQKNHAFPLHHLLHLRKVAGPQKIAQRAVRHGVVKTEAGCFPQHRPDLIF